MVTVNMFITMKIWITFIIHIEGPIRGYKVLLEQRPDDYNILYDI